MNILVDMDGVIVDFEQGIIDGLERDFSNITPIPLEKRVEFYTEKDYPEHERTFVHQVYTSEGFFLNLKPIEGAIEALHNLEKLGHDITICTSPISQFHYCVPEKYMWINNHLGFLKTKQIQMGKDKTRIKGDILIDDKPEITGYYKPEWEHVLYTQPFNKHINSKRRLTWTNYLEILSP